MPDAPPPTINKSGADAPDSRQKRVLAPETAGGSRRASSGVCVPVSMTGGSSLTSGASSPSISPSSPNASSAAAAAASFGDLSNDSLDGQQQQQQQNALIHKRRKVNVWPKVRHEVAELPEQLRTFMRRNLQYISGHDLAWPFREPVDDVALGIPDYYVVIKNPMDFGTLKRRYGHGWYESVSHFLSDFKLIFSNCYRFNNPSTDVHSMARDLEIFSRKYIEPLEILAAEEKKSKAKNENIPSKLPDSDIAVKDKKTKPDDRKKRNSLTPKEKNTTATKNRKTSLGKESKIETELPQKVSNVAKFSKSENAPRDSRKNLITSSPKSTEESNSVDMKRTFDTLNSKTQAHKYSKKASLRNSLSPRAKPAIHDSVNEANESATNGINDAAQNIDINNKPDLHQYVPQFLQNSYSKSRHNLFDPFLHYSTKASDAMEMKVHMDCQRILQILKHPDLSPIMWPFFNHPPETKYPDLAFIECSLAQGHYRTLEEFVTAIRHIFMNIITQFDRTSQLVELAHLGLEAFHDIYLNILDNRQSILSLSNLITNRSDNLTSKDRQATISDNSDNPANNQTAEVVDDQNFIFKSQDSKIDELYEFLMRDCEAAKNQVTFEQKIKQLDKRLSEVEKQFSTHKAHTNMTIDKLRKRISYLKSKQQSDLIFIHESFQVAVKKVASVASPLINGQLMLPGGASATGSVGSATSASTESNKYFKEKFKNYTKSKGIMPIRELDQMEQTSRSILLAGASKSDDEEESSRRLTAEEKRKLSHDINRLSQKMLAELIDIIAKHEGLNPEAEKELTLDYDKMKPATLRTVQRFVQSCIKRLPRLKQIQNIPVTNFFSEISTTNNGSTRNTGSTDSQARNAATDSAADISYSSCQLDQSVQTPESEVRLPNYPYFQNAQQAAANNSFDKTTQTSQNQHVQNSLIPGAVNSPVSAATLNSPIGNINKTLLNNHLINLKKTSANTQLNAAVQSLREQSSSTGSVTAAYSDINSLQHIDPAAGNASKLTSNLPDEQAIATNNILNDEEGNTWSSSFGAKHFQANSEALGEAKAIESVKGPVDFSQKHADSPINATDGEKAMSNSVNAGPSSSSTLNANQQKTDTQFIFDREKVTNTDKDRNALTTNDNSATINNIKQQTKEALKAEAQKRRAANADNKNEAILQRELIDSFEQQSSSNFI